MIIFLLSCVLHKTSLTGVVDNVSKEKCAIEIATGEVVVIESTICKQVQEGDVIYFYGRKP